MAHFKMNPIVAGTTSYQSSAIAPHAARGHDMVRSALVAAHLIVTSKDQHLANPTTTAHPRKHEGHRQGMKPLFAILATAALSIYAPNSFATPACDAWLGEFSTNPEGLSALRIEKRGQEYHLRFRQQDEQWNSENEPISPFPREEMEELGLSQHDCVLSARGLRLIAAPKGTPYEATSIGGSNFGQYQMKTRHLLILIRGFQVDGVDLFRVDGAGSRLSP
jgi:hypothetical protein